MTVKTADGLSELTEVQIIGNRDETLSVVPVWSAVDRPDSRSWNVPNMDVAIRLKEALLSGAAIRNPEVRTDVNGQTYVSYDSPVYGRTMRGDLSRLGY